jgi:signal peptidase I
MSKTNLPPALGLMRKYLIVFFLPIAYILVLNLIGIIPPFYLFIVFLIAIVWQFAASSTRKWLSGFTALLCFIPSLIVARTFVQEFRYVNGTSMEPSLQDRDRVIVDKLIYRFSDPQKGDLIIFFSEDAKVGSSENVKAGRIISLSGENVGASIEMPKDFHLVQIDSSDIQAANFQVVRRSEILGRIKSRFWPINRISLIHSEKAEALEVFKNLIEEIKNSEPQKAK